MPDHTTDETFFEQTFADALSLLEASRDLIAATARVRDDAVVPAVRMKVARDTSRLTSRAAAAMSLLLLYKALGEEQDEPLRDVPERLDELYAEAIGTGRVDPMAGVPLPTDLADLIERGEELFSRLPRLRSMIERRLPLH